MNPHHLDDTPLGNLQVLRLAGLLDTYCQVYIQLHLNPFKTCHPIKILNCCFA